MNGWLAYIASVAFLAGLAGGVHCAAMCGPILAVCARSRHAALPEWQQVLAYNAGRITAYVLAGAAAGALGLGALDFRGGAPAPAVLAALSGTAMLVLAMQLAGFKPVTRGLEAAGFWIWRGIQPWSKHVMPVTNWRRALGLGALWGWLPCGMVYAALIGAAAMADPVQGALVMLCFGLGTLPNIIGITFAAARIGPLLRFKPARLGIALMVAVLGALALAYAVVPPSHGLSTWLCRVLPASALLAR
jgi:uncharacterized protein